MKIVAKGSHVISSGHAQCSKYKLFLEGGS